MPERAEGASATAARGPSPALVAIFALAAGALVANLYYAQPLVASIGPELGISADLAGSVVSVTQLGYGCGLFLLVSLADLVENRRLVLTWSPSPRWAWSAWRRRPPPAILRGRLRHRHVLDGRPGAHTPARPSGTRREAGPRRRQRDGWPVDRHHAGTARCRCSSPPASAGARCSGARRR